MSDAQKLTQAYALLKTGTLWHNPDLGKPRHPCQGYADANPGEAQAIDQYVAALTAGQSPTPPVLTTATGRGIVGMIDAGFARTTPTGITVKSVVQAGSTIRWTAEASAPVAKVEFFIDGTPVHSGDSTAAYQVDSAKLTLGEHVLKVVVTTVAGEKAETSDVMRVTGASLSPVL